jgi:hypothetical protein
MTTNDDLKLINKNFFTTDEVNEVIDYCSANSPDIIMDNSSKYTSYIKNGTYTVHNLQQSINNLNPLKKELKSPKNYYIWKSNLSIEEKIKRFYPEAISCHIATMQPGTELHFHTDTVSKYYYRFHIPIKSNKDSFFYFNKDNNLKKYLVIDRNCYYFNTSISHSADNYGKNERIHITWLMPIATINNYIIGDNIVQVT